APFEKEAPLRTWKLTGADAVTVTLSVDGARVVTEQIAAGGRRKVSEKALKTPDEAARHAEEAVQRQVLEGRYDAGLAPRRVTFGAIAAGLGLPEGGEEAGDAVLVFD